jgi:hypothetical protein
MNHLGESRQRIHLVKQKLCLSSLIFIFCILVVCHIGISREASLAFQKINDFPFSKMMLLYGWDKV